MIYFIQNTETKAIKIGYTENSPQRRLKALQTGSSHPLELLATFNGDVYLERQLHQQFREYHLLGEWFDPGPELVSALVARLPELQHHPLLKDPEIGIPKVEGLKAVKTPVTEAWYMVSIAYAVTFILTLIQNGY